MRSKFKINKIIIIVFFFYSSFFLYSNMLPIALTFFHLESVFYPILV